MDRYVATTSVRLAYHRLRKQEPWMTGREVGYGVHENSGDEFMRMTAIVAGK